MLSLFWTKEFQCSINSNGPSGLLVYGLCCRCLIFYYCSAKSTAYNGRMILNALSKRTSDGEKQEHVASLVRINNQPLLMERINDECAENFFKGTTW
jgi:hypothetical protein